MMRALILYRIQILKTEKNGFSKSNSRWRNFYVGEYHISEIDFEVFDDEQLLNIYEKLIRREYIQM